MSPSASEVYAIANRATILQTGCTFAFVLEFYAHGVYLYHNFSSIGTLMSTTLHSVKECKIMKVQTEVKYSSK